MLPAYFEDTIRTAKKARSCRISSWKVPPQVFTPNTNSIKKNNFWSQKEDCVVRLSFFHRRDEEVLGVANMSLSCSELQSRGTHVRPEDFSFAQGEDRLFSTSLSYGCVTEFLGVAKTSSSGSPGSNLKKAKSNFLFPNKKFLLLFDCWWKKLLR